MESKFLSRVPEVDSTLYRQLVGSLLYLTHSHPDLLFVVGHVSHYMQTPHEIHWKVVKKYFDIFKVQFNLGFIIVQGDTFVGWFH